MSQENHAVLRQLGQPNMYQGPAEYLAWARKSYAAERALIQKLGSANSTP